MALILRLQKGTKLTAQEMDNNLIHLKTLADTIPTLDQVVSKGSITTLSVEIGDLTADNVDITSLNVNKNAAAISEEGTVITPKLELKESQQDPQNINPAPGGQITYYQGALYISNGSTWNEIAIGA